MIGKSLKSLRLCSDIIWCTRCLVCQRPSRSGLICRLCTPPAPISFSNDRCRACSSPIEINIEGMLCSLCIQTEPTLRMQRYLWLYHGNVRDIIIMMKYAPSKKLTRWMAQKLVGNIRSHFAFPLDWDMVVPIPSSPQNYAKRLFSPSRTLAHAVARSLTLKTRNDVLYHHTTSKAQAMLSHEERLIRAPLALGIRDVNLTDMRILLVDDVVTTGATALSASQLLKAHGALSVDVYSLARSPSWETTRREVLQKNKSPRASGVRTVQIIL